MNKAIKWTLLIIGTSALIYLGFITFVFMAFVSPFDPRYTTADLIDNYQNKTKQIEDLKAYINRIVPAGKCVDIEFEDDEIGIFHVSDSIYSDNNWNLTTGSTKTDSLLIALNWTSATLIDLKGKLDQANCISVKSGEPCVIGFNRSGMGKYFYNIFDDAIADSLKSHYNDSCTYILYNRKVVLQYGGGAIGPQCFPY